jgi:hypothetical protein
MRRNTGTIFWCITLIIIGALLLAGNFGYNIRVGGYIVRYWPSLLIVWGFLKLIDYYRFKKSGERSSLFSAGEVALLIFVVFAGAAVTTAANLSTDVGSVFDVDGIDLWDITGNNFTFEEHEDAAVADGSSIEIVNLFGNVEVRASNADRVLLDVKKTIRASTKDEAETLSKNFTFSIANEGDEYRIASSRISQERQRYKSSLVIQVPKRSSLRLNNRNGNVRVTDVGGNQDITAQVGNVIIELPSNSSFRINANTEFGRIDSGFRGLQMNKSNRETSLTGVVGQAGPQITISARHGNIRLVRRT